MPTLMTRPPAPVGGRMDRGFAGVQIYPAIDIRGGRSVCDLFPARVVLGLDARHGKVATNGWLELSERSALELAREAAAWPIAGIVYTDISRDGMLEGPNFEAYAELLAAVATPVFASGGISTLGQIQRLAELGVAGCVIGRAIYEGQLDLQAVIDNVNSAVGARREARDTRHE